MNIIKKKFWFLSVSGTLLIASIGAIALFGFRPGIDFSGGTLWQIRFTEKEVTLPEVKEFFVKDLGIENAIITAETSGDSFVARVPEIKEQDHAAYLTKATKTFGAVDELRFETIGAAVGKELRGKAITAFILVLVGISIYIAFAFRKVSRPVSSWKYGIITLLTLFHDALIPAGLFAVLGRLMHVEVDTNFIVAILVVMGFSVHDTIVVFDRIRENLRLAGSSKFDFDELVNKSVNQTMARSINTSLTLVLVLIALYFFGSETLKYFVLTIGVGTIFGTYSSIFVASPLLTMWRKKGAA
jgi:preprotein translocase subunit SecF